MTARINIQCQPTPVVFQAEAETTGDLASDFGEGLSDDFGNIVTGDN